jgi:uncharacterized SAM-binding protein YcdF (DUF218 family)
VLLARRAAKLALLAGVVLVAYLLVTFAQVWMAARRDAARPADAIVVLGAAQYDGEPSPVFAARLDHAAALYDRGVAPTVVLTGGRRPGDRFTEASAAAAYLGRMGVPQAALLLESGGATSWESLAAAARILRTRGMDEVVLVSDSYHAYRIEAIAEEVGLQATVSPVRSDPSVGHLAREAGIVAVGRIVGFGRLQRLDEQVGRVRESAGSG